MATYYVDPVAGLDANPGTEAEPKQTFAAGIVLCNTKNDILRLRNSGPITWTVQTDGTALVNGTIGTSFVDYGVLIEGVDADNNPATATIAATGANGNRSLVRVNHNTGYLIWRNIKFDASALAADGATYEVCEHNDAGAPDPGPIRFEGCGFIGGATGVRPVGPRLPIAVTAGPGALGSDVAEFDHCYFQNMPANIVSASLGGRKVKFDHCVDIVDSAALGAAIFDLGSFESASGLLRFKNCTVYWKVDAFAINTVLGYAPSTATDVGVVDIYNNVFYFESTVASPNIILFDGTGGATSVTKTGTIDYNVFLGGPSITGIADVSVNGPYRQPWGTPQNFQANDTVAYSVAEASVFNAPASTYVWSPLGTAATLTLLKDLRLIDHTTAGLAGVLPGALGLPETDYSASVTTDVVAPFPEEAVTLTLTAANNGEFASSVVFSAPIPAGLSLVTATPSAGSYDSGTGLWTIGSMLDAASETLTLAVTVDADQGGNSITFTGAFSSGNPSTDSDTSNDSDSVTLTVQVDEEIDSGTVPYLDVAPIYAPVLHSEINASVYTKRNRLRQHDLRHDYDDDYREYTSRRITIAPSTTVQLISGIERASYIVAESTADILPSLSIGDTNHFFPPATRFAVLAGDLSVIKFTNPSASASVDVLVVVID